MIIETVQDLLDALDGVDPTSPVRIASVGHRSRFEYAVDGAAAMPGEGGGDDGDVFYIGEGSQLGYLPAGVADELGL
jgi:hypothetical protein